MNLTNVSRRQFLKASTAAVASLPWLAACVVAPATQPDSGEPAAPSQETIVLSWYDWKLTEEPAGSVVRGILAQFQEANPNYQIEEEPVAWGDHLQQLVIKTQGGTAPDIARIAGGGYLSLIDSGALLPVSDLAVAHGVQDIWENSPPALVEDAKYNGQDYLMPDGTGTDVLTYNAQQFQEVGLDPDRPPATWDELIEYGQRLTDPAQDRYGWGLMGARQQSASRRAVQWCLDAGAQLFNEDGTQLAINSEEGLQGFTFWANLELEYGIAPPGSVSADFQSIMVAYAQGRVSMWEGGPNNAQMGEQNVPGTIEKTRMAAKPDPWHPVAGLDGIVLMAQTESPDEAFKLASYWCSREANLQWCLGNYSIPARQDVANDPRLQEERLLAETAVLMSRTGPDPKRHVKWPEIQEYWFDAMAAALSESKTPEQALADFVVEGDAILQRWVETGA